MTRWLRVRWAIDRVVAAALLTIAGPAIVVLAWGVRRTDGAPAFVGLTRVGQHGLAFKMWKLRTLRADLPDGTAAGPPLSGWADTRVTRFGHGLRRWRLDELPQLWNVCRGEMALIGPRPEAPEFVNDDPAWQAALAARPGIAGPTQIVLHHVEAELVDEPDGPTRYRRDVLPAKLAVDRWYLESASPLLDGLVLAAIIDRFVFRRAGRFMDRKVAASVSPFAALTAADGLRSRA